MNKKKMCILWLIDVIIMFVLIVIPKNETIYNITYKIFLLTTFIIPLILSLFSFQLWKKDNVNTFNIQVIGQTLIILLSFIRFIKNIESIAIWMYIFSMLTIIVLMCITMYFAKVVKTNKQYIYCLIFNLGLMYISFFISMIISYDYSLVW